MQRAFGIMIFFGSLCLIACHQAQDRQLLPNTSEKLATILAPHEGTTAIDEKIIRLQQILRQPTPHNESEPVRNIEKLGWAFIEKARQSFDMGYYKLAETCALYIEAKQPDNPDALLLRGHALNSLHRFREAESLARNLTARRELHFDFALLGDALMEQGKLDEAIPAYQKMMDLKPSPEAYSRAAHVRWLRGDLDGAIDMMALAAQSSVQGNPEAAAWAHTRLALYELQAGDTKLALAAGLRALAFKEDFAPAYLAKGRALLNAGKLSEAIESLKRATGLNPLPEYQWTLADALRSANRAQEAEVIETALCEQGATNDPRTFALFLATRNLQSDKALALAQAELKERRDVFTLDALAWSFANAGRWEEAHRLMRRAIAQGTKDARLFFHAGVISATLGEHRAARRWFHQAQKIKQMLLPSEQKRLEASLSQLPA
ncbi:MAG: tetratricopeptide repeat protein [Acidobacteriota bacterium]